jgi:hypothetical protein
MINTGVGWGCPLIRLAKRTNKTIYLSYRAAGGFTRPAGQDYVNKEVEIAVKLIEHLSGSLCSCCLNRHPHHSH